MKVIAAMNGQISSEIAALYALRYAHIHASPLILLHVANPEDDRDTVERSMGVIEEAASSLSQECERVFLQGKPIRAIKNFLVGTKSGMLFCSTRIRRHFFENSFSEELTRLSLPVDLAVVRAVHLDDVYEVENSVLSIREDRLSEDKFALFAAFCKSYEAAAEIYSVTVVRKRKLAGLSIPVTRDMLRRINDRLAHYLRLSRLIDIPLRIKHAIALNEVDQLLHHLSRHHFQLMVIGGQRLSGISHLFGEKPIERFFRYTPVNIIAFYSGKKE